MCCFFHAGRVIKQPGAGFAWCGCLNKGGMAQGKLMGGNILRQEYYCLGGKEQVQSPNDAFLRTYLSLGDAGLRRCWWTYIVDTILLLYKGCVFNISWLLLLLVLGFICYLVWFGRFFFFWSHKAQFFSHVNEWKLVLHFTLFRLMKSFTGTFYFRGNGGNL